MTSNRQLLINKIFANGIGLTGVEIDKNLKLFNDFQMSLNDRIKNLLSNESEFNKFLDFLRKQCNLS